MLHLTASLRCKNQPTSYSIYCEKCTLAQVNIKFKLTGMVQYVKKASKPYSHNLRKNNGSYVRIFQ